MGGKGITGYVALSIGLSELFKAEANSNPAHKGDPKGPSNRTLMPTQDTERLLDLIQFSRHLAGYSHFRAPVFLHHYRYFNMLK